MKFFESRVREVVPRSLSKTLLFVLLFGVRYGQAANIELIVDFPPIPYKSVSAAKLYEIYMNSQEHKEATGLPKIGGYINHTLNPTLNPRGPYQFDLAFPISR